MPHAYGTIKQGDKILIEDLVVVYEMTKGARSGLSSWYGSFVLPAEKLKQIKPGGPYRLILDDGRSGDIRTTNIPIGSSTLGYSVHFEGSGALK
jgi:hypothetical protein